MHPHHIHHTLWRNLRWHHHLSAGGLALALVSFLLGAGGSVAYRHVHGGFRPGPLPPTQHLSGHPLPPSWSLDRFLVRVHNQGDSNSCVGQTLATITEITNREFALAHPEYQRNHPFFGPNTAFSAEFIWNQTNGGTNQGVTYQAAFSLLQAEGDAPLDTFPADGATDYFEWPGSYPMFYAAQHRIATWYPVSPSDRYTIEANLVAGHPLAFAIPVRDSVYDQFGDTSMPYVADDTGTYWFDHSMTIIGYTPAGVEVLNSWGPGWGDQGRAIFSWQLLVDAGAYLVASIPAYPSVPPAVRHHKTDGRTAPRAHPAMWGRNYKAGGTTPPARGR